MRGVIAAATLALAAFGWRQHAASQVHLQVDASPLQRDVHRLGVNLGHWTNWGAEQLMANVVKNPGFEGVIDRSLVVVREASTGVFVDETDWLTRGDGFWTGARYHVRSGELAGRGGVVTHYRARHDGLGEFSVAETLAGLRPGDVISVTRLEEADPPPNWWFTGFTASRPGARTGGAGNRVLMIRSGGTASSYFDTIGERAGKLLPMGGTWELTFWARCVAPGCVLHLRMFRDRNPPFLDQVLRPEGEWAKYSYRFEPKDDGPPGPLELRFSLSGAGAQIELDDVSLSPVSAASAFRDEVVDTLRDLRPGYLRDWQGQLGDTWANRIARATERRAFRYRQGGPEFAYSLPEFLELCAQVGADPWVVLPTTLDDAEWTEAGRYLAAERLRYGFREVVVEFGNENWNELFRPAGLMDPARHAAVAERAWRLFRNGTGPGSGFKLVVNGWFYNPNSARATARLADSADGLAVAPYWGFETPNGLADLFSHSTEEWARLNTSKPLYIYEMNAHSLSGAAPPQSVNRLIAGAASGAALAWHAVNALRAGVAAQCVYVLSGFDAFRDGDRELIRLFGITRDLSVPRRYRPTGLATQLINRVLAGDVHSVSENDEIAAVAFQSDGAWSAIAVNGTAEERTVVLVFPAGTPPRRIEWLRAASPFDTNEEEERVAIAEELVRPDGNAVAFSLPPYGMALLRP